MFITFLSFQADDRIITLLAYPGLLLAALSQISLKGISGGKK